MGKAKEIAGNPTLFRWHSASIPGFEICYCRNIRFDASERFVFGAYTVTLVEAGRGSFVRDAQRCDDVTAGSIAVSAPGDVIAAHSLDEGISCRNLYLSPALLAELAGGDAAPPVFRLSQRSTKPPDLATFSALEAATRALDQADPLERDTRLWCGLRNFVTGGCRLTDGDGRHERAGIRRARELLLDRLDENVALDELADAACLNRFHLLRVFQLQTGLPPHRYQQHARIGRARALLANGASALQAGIEVGFSDQPHFTRVFKQHLGVTPGAYRAMFDGAKSHHYTRIPQKDRRRSPKIAQALPHR